MSDSEEDFEDRGELGAEDGHFPLLPADDRLWRHPSELAADRPGRAPSRAEDARTAWVATPPSRAGVWTAGLVGALLAAGLVLVGSHLSSALTNHSLDMGHDPGSLTVAREPTATTTAVVGASDSGSAIHAMIARVAGAMVMISATTGRDPSTGVGLVAEADGVIITTDSLVAGATAIAVTLPDGKTLRARVVGSDPRSDIAVLRVGASDLTTAPLDDDDDIEPGMLTWLVARPASGASPAAAYPAQVTGVGTLPPAPGSPALMEAIRVSTDVKLAGPGFDGVLLDEDGNVAGLITDFARGTAIALPCWLALPVAEDLLVSGRVDHGWLGILGETAPAGLGTTGVRILAVRPGSGAARAGLHTGEVILSVDGSDVATLGELQADLYIRPPGEAVSIGVEDAGKRETAVVTLSGSS